MIAIKRQTKGARYFVPQYAGDCKSGTVCSNKREAGYWIHLRKMASARRIIESRDFPAIAHISLLPRDTLGMRQRWQETVCQCCGQKTAKIRTMHPDMRERLEFLRRKYARLMEHDL